MLRPLLQLLKCAKGVAAMEFAMIAPVMVTIFLGTVELTNFASVDKKVTKAAFTVADLIAQERQVTDLDIANVFRASELIMEPFDVTIRVGVASVRYDVDNAPFIDWEESYNGGSPGNALEAAAGLGMAGESVIVVGVQYAYSSIIGGPVDLAGIDLEEYSVQKPRRTAYIIRN